MKRHLQEGGRALNPFTLSLQLEGNKYFIISNSSHIFFHISINVITQLTFPFFSSFKIYKSQIYFQSVLRQIPFLSLFECPHHFYVNVTNNSTITI